MMGQCFAYSCQIQDIDSALASSFRNGIASHERIRTERRAIVPSAAGGITRLAYALAEDKGTDVDILLRKSGLSPNQIRDPNARLEVQHQIKFLDFVAEVVDDDLLGFHLSQTFDLRTVGLLYYVIASSARLDEALRRGARYSSIVNEGIKLTLHDGESAAYYSNTLVSRVI